MKIKKEFIVRNIMGENILVPRGSTALDFNGLITLNEVALDIWTMLPDAKDEADVVKRLIEIYDVDEQTAAKDVSGLLAQLREADILE